MNVYLSENTNQNIIASLIDKGFKVNFLPAFSLLENPVSSHADMLICAVDDKLFVYNDYEFKADGKIILRVNDKIGREYPDDVALNIAVVGKNVFCNTKFASKCVIEYLERKEYCIHHVNQGYAHCSTCIVNDNAIITADLGIFKVAEMAGVDALLISEGNISLPPYKHGFIGGAMGATGDTVYFCGSLNYHPDGESIRGFVQKHYKNVVELCDCPLSDIGGMLFLD